MRQIDIEEDIYEYLRTKAELGESVSGLLRRLLGIAGATGSNPPPTQAMNRPIETPHSSPELPAKLPSLSLPTQPRVHESLGSPTRPAPIPENSRVLELLWELRGLRGQQVVDRLLCILSWLCRQNLEQFERVRQIRGKKRVYFSTERDEIERSGNNTYPVSIPQTNWFVLTNTSTDHKIGILTDVMRLLRVASDDQEVILGALLKDPVTLPHHVPTEPYDHRRPDCDEDDGLI